jgi:hypothetical protein
MRFWYTSLCNRSPKSYELVWFCLKSSLQEYAHRGGDISWRIGFSTIRGMAELDILRCLPWYKLSLYASEPGAHHLEEVPERDQCAGVGAQ